MKVALHSERSFTPALLAAAVGTIAASAGWLAPRAVDLDTRALFALSLAVLGAAACFVPLRRVDLALLVTGLVGLAAFTAVHHSDQWSQAEPHLFYDTAIARVALPEWLLLGAAAAALACTTPRQWMQVGPIPFLLGGVMAYGLLVGVVEGVSSAEALRDARKLGVAILMHVAVVLTLRSPRRLRLFATAFGLAAVVAAVKQILLWLDGVGFEYRGFLRGSVDVGDFIVLGALICGATARLRHGVGSRWSAWGWIALGTMAVFATGSRAAWCSIPVGLGVVLLLRDRMRSRGRRLLAGAILAFGAVTPFLFSDHAESAWDRLRSLSDPTRDSSVHYRWVEVKGTAAHIAERPLTGEGFGVGFDAASALVDRRAKDRQLVHNLGLWVGVKAGVPGMLLFAVVLGLILRGLLRARRGLRSHPELVVTVLACLAMFLSIGTVGAMLNQLRVAAFFGVITGLSVVLARAAADRAEPVPARELRR